MRRFVLLVGLAGCAEPVTFDLASGFGNRWELFNHRLAHASFGVGDAATIAIIGGASTTGVVAELPEGCEADTCKEFPFFDDAAVWVEADRVSARGLVAGQGAVALEVGVDGAAGEVTVPFDRVPEGGVEAWIAGFSLDTRHPLSGGPSCYDPAFGWMPAEMGVTVGVPVVGDAGITVPVEATFVAGESLEDVRTCIDAVNDQAVVDLVIDVGVAAGGLTSERRAVAHGQTYPYGDGPFDPDPQPAPDLASRGLDGVEGAALGWSAVRYRFHVDDPQHRGAYLRSWSFLATAADGGSASGHADNFSPPTQITGFDYQFEGEVVVLVPDRGEVTRRAASATIPAALDTDGVPILTDLVFE